MASEGRFVRAFRLRRFSYSRLRLPFPATYPAVTRPLGATVDLHFMASQPSSSKAPVSPISLLLHGLGMTREDLTRHSDQMRQFLDQERSGSLRALAQERSQSDVTSTPTPTPGHSRANSRSFSGTDASTGSRSTPPLITPIKSEPVEPVLSSRRYDSMEEVIERQNRNRRRTRSERDDTPSPPPSRSRPVSRAASSSRARVSGRAIPPVDRKTTRPGTSEVVMFHLLSPSIDVLF